MEKGVAKLANGKNYTGKLIHKLKDGKTLVMEYKNGILQIAKKMDGETVLAGKVYEYDFWGLSKIKDINSDNQILTVDRWKTEITYNIGEKNSVTIRNGSVYKPIIVSKNYENYDEDFRTYCLRGFLSKRYRLLIESPKGSHIQTFYKEDGSKWFSLDRFDYKTLKVYDNEGNIINYAPSELYCKHNDYCKMARKLEIKYLR